MELEQLKPLTPVAYVIGISLFLALFKYLKSHPKYSQLKSVQTMERMENPSKQDTIWLWKLFGGIFGAFVLVMVIVIVFFPG
jgi:uncharacterized membrane protein YdcZ (DUF606 family)